MKGKKLLIIFAIVSLIICACESRRIKQGRLKPGEVAIIQFSPTGMLSRPEDMEIHFSSQVIDEKQSGNEVDEKLISVNPKLEKRCRWHSQSSIRCYLRGLKPRTNYEVEVSKAIIPRESRLELVGQRKFQFSLAGLQLSGVNLRFLSYRDPPQVGIVFSFNQPVDARELESRLKIFAPDGKQIDFTMNSWGSNENIEVATYLDGYRKFKWKFLSLKIDGTLPDASRTSTLEQDFERELTLPAPGKLVVTSSEPVQMEKMSYIRVCFSSAVEPDKFAGYFSISPAIEFNLESDENCINIMANFQPGQSFTINIKKGLQSSVDQTLEDDYSGTILIPDIQPKISLIGSGHYLPRKGAMNLGLETINTDSVYLRVKKIFPNNLVYFLGGKSDYYCGGYDYEENTYIETSQDECVLNRNLELLGKQILEKELTVQNVKNKIVTTVLPLEDLVGKDRQGIYAVSVYKEKDSWYSNAFVWMIATDLGIIAHKSDDRLMVLVRSLENLGPQDGVRVRLLSKNNQTLADGVTDARGIVEFPGLSRAFKESNPFLIIAEKGSDFSFLAFDRSSFNTSSFDIAGDQYISGNYEAYLYPERDVYRPGETAHLAYLLRDEKLAVPPNFPVTLKVLTPDNRLFKTLKSQPDSLGSGEFEISFPRDVLTGLYALELYGPEDDPIGTMDLRIEEFMPDRMKVVITPEKEHWLGGEKLNFNIKANYLFGPPVANQNSRATCRIEERSVLFDAYRDFSFRNALEKRMEPINLNLGENTLDENGESGYSCNIPSGLHPSSGGLSATIQASVFEPGGGRAVTARKMLEIDPYPVYLGIRRDFEKEPAPGESVRFSIIALNPDGKPEQARELIARFYKLEWNSVVKFENGMYRYVSEMKKNKIKELKLNSSSKPVQLEFSYSSQGDFALEITDLQSGAMSADEFYVWGWGYAPWAMKNPDKIELTLDKKDYVPGEDAKILVKAPFSGKLLVMVETNRMLYYREYDLKENTATLTVPVLDSFKPNAYVVATLLRSFRSTERFAPLRAVGIVPLKLNLSQRKLDIKISAPKKIRPNTELEVMIDAPEGAGGNLTLSAVDEGILQLTGFASPDPLSFYYRKRLLPFGFFDLYSMVLPEVIPVPPRSPFGGDISRERLRRELAPLSVSRVKPVSLWSGVLSLGNQGKATVKFRVPQFNGTLRLMAVAFTANKMGSAESSVIVREPITITSSFPRFLAPGDEFIVPVTIFNGTGAKGDFTAEIETKGKVIIRQKSRSVFIEKDGEATVRFEAEAGQATGTDTFLVKVSGPNNEKSIEETEISIRPPYPLYSKTGVVSVTESAPASFKLPGGWIKGTENFKITTFSVPLLNYSESLKYLVHYPYGCVEQTTSSAFPLLYFKDIARVVAPELFKDKSIDYFVNEAISKLCSMNMGNGAFSFWPDGRYQSYPWSSIYATHFLLEAKKAGYNVPEIILSRSLDYLWAYSNDRTVKDYWECEQLAYALYVLALGGKPNSYAMDWILKSNVCKLDDIETRTLIAGAYAYKGDMTTAKKLLPVGAKPATGKIDTGRSFYSPARANALALNVLLDVSQEHPAIPALVKAISDQAKGGKWYNTQENAFGFVALGKYYRTQDKADYKGTLSIDNQEIGQFDQNGSIISSSDWADKTVNARITGSGTAYIYWEASGIPDKPPEIKPESSGIEISREYLDERGSPLDLKSIQQGALVIVKTNVKALNNNLENVVMSDLLPAGLEIENPRLLTTAKPDWILDKTEEPQYMDIRDDRLLTFQSLRAGDPFVLYYTTRAVTAGTFILPPVKAEAMYDPSYRAISEMGTIKIKERK